MRLNDGRFLKITELFAFISVDPRTKSEGIMSIISPDGKIIMPLIGADLEKVESLIPHAEYISQKHKVNYEIRYFEVKR